MLTRDQIKAIEKLSLDRHSRFFQFTDKFIRNLLIYSDKDTNHEFTQALRLAASSIEEDMVTLVQMINANPRLLLLAGDVTTRGGVRAKRVTLYEFFLGEGDPVGAKRIEFGFKKIPNGESQRLSQYERYRPHIEAMKKQIEEKRPAYDLRPLIDVIINSPDADIDEALNINDPNRITTRDTPLRIALAEFRKAVEPEEVNVGMHYKHYTTLQQACDILDNDNDWNALSYNNTNFNRCCLVWAQVIGYLQLKGLPAVDRFGFALAFEDESRTLNCIYDNTIFPDCVGELDRDLTRLGSSVGIFGCVLALRVLPPAARRGFFQHMSTKNFRLAEPVSQTTMQPSGCVIS